MWRSQRNTPGRTPIREINAIEEAECRAEEDIQYLTWGVEKVWER